MQSGAARLRMALVSGELIVAPGGYDPLSAGCAMRAGFDAVYLGGNALGLHLGKGQPFVTLTETVQAAARIVAALDPILVVDAGAGFGHPSHVHLAIREIEAAGAAAIHIDDQPYPKSVGYHRGQGSLATIEAAAAKLRIAARSRRNLDMLVIARIDALRVTKSMDEAIARCRAFVAAGAEALLVLDLTPQAAPVLAAAVPGVPLVWIGGVAPPIPTVAELAAAGFAMALYPFNAVAAVTTALNDLWSGLAATGAVAQTPELLARARVETLEAVDMASHWAIEDETA